MNKVSKILLCINIILVIAIIVISVFYVNEKKSSKGLENKLLEANTYLYKNVKAIEDAGLKTELQDDGSYTLIENDLEN